MTAYERGAKRERQVLRMLREDGWYAERTGGSRGVADIIALKDGKVPRLIQVKADSVGAGPFAHFGPDDRADLLLVAEMAGAQAWLLWWPPHGEAQWIGPSQWPKIV